MSCWGGADEHATCIELCRQLKLERMALDWADLQQAATQEDLRQLSGTAAAR